MIYWLIHLLIIILWRLPNPFWHVLLLPNYCYIISSYTHSILKVAEPVLACFPAIILIIFLLLLSELLNIYWLNRFISSFQRLKNADANVLMDGRFLDQEFQPLPRDPIDATRVKLPTYFPFSTIKIQHLPTTEFLQTHGPA